MASEHIIISRPNDDSTGVVEQYPKTLSTVVYDVNNGKYLNETIEELKQNGTNKVEVVDSLTSTSSTSALSARQGKVLSDKDKALSDKIDILTDDVMVNYSTKTELTNHDNKIASITELGHIKPDGETIVVDPVTGIASSVGGGSDYQLTDGEYAKKTDINDFNLLINSGFYQLEGSPSNAPNSISSMFKWMVQVLSYIDEANDGVVVIQVAYDTALTTLHMRERIASGTWTAWSPVVKLNNSLVSTSTTEGASAYAVKQVNDKLNNTSVILGASASVTSNTYANVSIGESAKAGSNSIAIGREAKADGVYFNIALGAYSEATGKVSFAAGYYSKSLNDNTGVLGTSGGDGGGVSIWQIPGSLAVTGTKNFEMPHPAPHKKATHVIRHGAVESPTAGDTLYRYTVEATEDGQTIELILPDYFKYLNKNVDVWVNPYKHFGRAFGEVVEDKLIVTCELAGVYKALVIGTRNDNHESVQNWNIKGVEREIGESWNGETYVFEVDEITEVQEITEVK